MDVLLGDEHGLRLMIPDYGHQIGRDVSCNASGIGSRDTVLLARVLGRESS